MRKYHCNKKKLLLSPRKLWVTLALLLCGGAWAGEPWQPPQGSGDSYVYVNLFDTICEGTATYTEHGFNIGVDTLAARASDYVFYRVSAGNDSVYYLWLTVLPSYNVADTQHVCQNALPYSYGGRLFGTTTLTGDYNVSMTAANGCDSVVRLHLYIDTMLLRDTIAITCHSFTWDRTGRTFSTPGYSQPDSYLLPGSNGGCDTMLRLGLLIYDTVRTYIDSIVCGSYLFGGETYDSDDTLWAYAGTSWQHGCDSVCYYRFHVLQPSHGDFYVEAYDDTYTWPDSIGGSGATFYISGQTDRVTPGSNGCDSTTTLHLTLHGMPQWCTNDTFPNDQFEDFHIAAPHAVGVYGIFLRDGLTASDGRSDSIALLRYQFMPHYFRPEADTICSSETLTFHGSQLSHPGETGGEYRDTVWFVSRQGCDSAHVAMLKVFPSYKDTVAEYYCRAAVDYRRGDSAITYNDTLLTVARCDSIVTRGQLHLVPDTVLYHRVACVAYTWEPTDGVNSFSRTYVNNGTTPRYFIPDSNNTDTVRLQNIGGCDSVVSLSLILNPQTVVDTVVSVCYEYAWPHRDTVFGVGSYPGFIDTIERGNRYRCDSILRMNITVHDTVRVSFDSNVCESYTFGGATYTESGMRRGVVGTSAAGCDSVAYVVFTLYHNKETHHYRRVYDSLYRWSEGNDSTYRSSTHDSFTVPLTGGCDSVVRLHLSMEPMPVWCSNIYLPDSMYYGFKVEDLSIGLHRPAVVDTLQAPDGGDDTIAILSYRIKKAYTKSDTMGICAVDSLTWHGRTFFYPDSVGVHNDTVYYTAVNGCDSLFALRLIVADNFNDTTRITICRGSYHIFTERFEHCEGLPWGWSSRGGDWHAASGIDGDHRPADGDSAAYMVGTNSHNYTFLVSPPIDLRYSDTADITFWYINPQVNGNLNSVCLFWTETPDVMSSWQSLWCERSNVNVWSNTVLHLRGPQYKKIIYLGFRSYDLGGCTGFDRISVSGYNNSPNDTTYVTVDSLHSVKGGCDSVVTRIVKVIGPTSSTVYGEACVDYTWTVYDPEGYIAFSKDYHNSADTLLHLTAASGNTDTAYLENMGGCDSLLVLDLKLKANTHGQHDSVTRCNPYTWRVQQLDGKWETAGTFYAEDTVAQYSIMNAAGCDSILTLVYHFTAHIDSATEVKACDSYTFKGRTYYDTAIARDTLMRSVSDGCDTVVTYQLSIAHTTYGSDTNEVCDSLVWIDGRTYRSSTNRVYDTLVNAVQCDSVVRLFLTVQHSPMYIIDTEVCDYYTYNGTRFDSTDTYSWRYPIGFVCDSVVELRLTVNHASFDTVPMTHCGAYNWNGFQCDSTGLYNQLFVDRHGCDSTVWLSLTVAQSRDTDIYDRACYSYQWYGVWYTASGIYTHRIPATDDGCDSVVTLYLEVDSIYSIRIDTAACVSLVWQGTTYTSSTTNSWHYTSREGCDSIVTLNAVINQPVATETTVNACDQYIWNGLIYSRSGRYAQTLQSLLTGCDSTSTIDLRLHPTVHTSFDTFACDSYEWNGTTYGRTGTFSQYLTSHYGCDSVVDMHLVVGHTSNTSFADTAYGFYTWNDITYTTTGIYTQYFVGRSGCDSTVTLFLTIYDGIDAAENANLSIYPNPVHDVVNIVGEEVFAVTVYDAVGRKVIHAERSNQISLAALPKGMYTLRVTTGTGVWVQRIVKQ
ncbi:MAG: T9SS type A sorting domain-containing protein [Bacteroidales bacterium]|nr:T9SS type A sorting domain-containing protein [Bacteroidales bacterium]